MICELCEETISPDEDYDTLNGGRSRAHCTCLVRAVMGGIGHLENHSYWCREQHDPDGGRTLYQSGLEVMAWIKLHGIPG